LSAEYANLTRRSKKLNLSSEGFRIQLFGKSVKEWAALDWGFPRYWYMKLVVLLLS